MKRDVLIIGYGIVGNNLAKKLQDIKYAKKKIEIIL